MLGAVNALLVGATLSLIEQSISHARALTIRDVLGSVGHYFWDVIGIGFILWLPLMALDLSTQTNPFGQLISYAALLLTPPLAVAMLLFRGHLFASLHGVSRRQRRFVTPFK